MPAVSHVFLGVGEFHARLSELLRRVEREYLCVHISLRGRPVAVLASESAYAPSDVARSPAPVRTQSPPEERLGSPASARLRPRGILQRLERQMILDAVRQQKGTRRAVAKMLGIGERTLYRKLREMGVSNHGTLGDDD